MHPLLEQNQLTVLGRARNRIFSSITGSLDEIPSDREVMRYIMQRWKENREDGRFHFHLLFLNRVNAVIFPARFSARAFNQILRRLNRSEVFDRIYAEGRLQGPRIPREKGCLVLGHRRPNEEPGYYAIVFDDEHFLDKFSFTSLVPDGAEGSGRVDILTPEGWENVESGEAHRFPQVRIVLATLRDHLNRIDPRLVDLRTIKVDQSTKPPTDKELIRRLIAVHKRKSQITVGNIPLNKIVPFSLGFSTKISRLVDTSRLADGYRPRLLVYWRGDAFVMSDDYLNFLGYRKLNIASVPVAIVGDFPATDVTVSATGGPELIPPAGIGFGTKPLPSSAPLEQWLIDQRLSKDNRRAIPSELAASWLVLADLLADPNTSEADVQNYLLEFPTILAPSGKAIESEVWLGTKYKMDVVIRAAGVTEDVSIVELENPNHLFFTRDGRPRKQVTHAKQQVEDWLRWIKENPNDAFVQTLRGLPPRGLVVIGKSRQLDDEQRRRLAHLNSNSDVQIITYDELLDRFGDLILQQCDDNRG